MDDFDIYDTLSTLIGLGQAFMTTTRILGHGSKFSESEMSTLQSAADILKEKRKDLIQSIESDK